MKNGKKLSAVLTSAVLIVSLAACGSSDTAATAAAIQEESTAEVKETEPSVTSADADTLITFSDDDIDVDGSGAEADGNILTITEAGKYALSGRTSSGQVVVDAGDEDTVTLILDGLDITCEDDAAIYIKNAKLAGVILADESENRVQSGAVKEIDISAKNSDEEDASGAALQAKCDLTLSGNGNLEVFGYINNGIQSSASLIIDSGEIEVSAVHHTIKGETVTVKDGDISLTAMQDGIHSDDAVTIEGGNITIATGDDAIHADNDLTIEDGVVNITDSYEGIEAVNILISGGEVNLVSTDDGINASDGSGGGFGPMGNSPLPDGFDPSEMLEYIMENGSLEGFEFPEGFELPEGFEFPEDPMMSGGFGGMDRGDGQMPEGFGGMDRGDGRMPEGFDGMDRGDGRIPEGFGGMDRGDGRMPGSEDSQKSPDELPTLRITGGTVKVNAQGDGIDSNGNLYIEGGLIIVDGPTLGANGALDYGSENGGECLISGGTVLAVGSSGMAETFGSGSSQCSFLVNFDASFDEGDTLTITAEDGIVLFEYDIVKKGSSVVFSSPELTVGDTVTVEVGDQSKEITLDSVSVREGGSGMGGFGAGFDFDDRENMPDFGDRENMPDFSDRENMPDFGDREDMPAGGFGGRGGMPGGGGFGGQGRN